jgi:LCP family protein required for cell wall assembly
MSVQTPRRAPSMDRDAVRGSKGPTPPAAPPAIKKTRRKDPLWARLTVVFGAVLMMASGAGIVGTKWFISNATSNITTENLIGDTQKTAAEGGKSLDGSIDMLLMGVDARARWAVDELHADTIIILHIPATHDQAYLVSVPRDTKVQVPAFPKSKYAGGTAKATEAFYWGAQNGGGWAGGAQLLAKTLKNETGISFDGAAIIDFNGFRGVIDALGSIRMCVDHKVKSHHMYMVDGKPMYKADARKIGRLQNPVVHKVGCREMEGWEALDYARQRYGLPNGDYDRQRHQQQLIKAMAKKASSSGVLTDLGKVNKLIEAAGKAFVLDTGGTKVEDYLFTMKGVAANDMVLLRTNNGTFAGDGSGRETITAESQEMFTALKEDRLAEYVIANPGVVAKEK